MAEWLLSLRAFGAVGRIGTRLCEMPGGGDYSGAGDLYRALALNHTPGDRAQADYLLHQVLECGSPAFRAKALLALGSNHLLGGDLSNALKYYHNSLRSDGSNLLNAFCATMMSIAVRGLGGDHAGAVAALESLRPLAAFVGGYYPAYWFAYLNSLAVELCEVGKLDEAMRLSRRAAGSPFSRAYPEYGQTYEELRERATCRQQAVVRLASPKKPLGLQGRGISFEARAVVLKDHLPLIEQRRRSINALLDNPPAPMVRSIYRIVCGYAPVGVSG